MAHYHFGYLFNPDRGETPPGPVERTTATHSSATSTTGTVTEYGYLGDYEGWKAFNKDTTDPTIKWLSDIAGVEVWVQYEFNVNVKLKSWRFYPNLLNNGDVAPTRQLKAFDILGSTDGVIWDTIQQYIDLTLVSNPQWSQLYTINTANYYKFIKLDVHSNHGDGLYVGAQELELNYEEEI